MLRLVTRGRRLTLVLDAIRRVLTETPAHDFLTYGKSASVISYSYDDFFHLQRKPRLLVDASLTEAMLALMAECNLSSMCHERCDFP